MKSFSKTKDIEKILRQYLHSESNVELSQILNSLSYSGAELEELMSENIYSSIWNDDILILFELKSRQSSSDSTQSIDESNVVSIQSYSLHVIIYGDSSYDVATTIQAKFETERIRQKLYDDGLYLESISKLDKVNEFINNRMWIRTDFDINVSCKFDISSVSDEDYKNVVIDSLITI